MIISVASGKGGTGKTTVATNLAFSVGENVRILDCDVEEPNAHLFLAPEIEKSETVFTPVPEIDESKCTYCKKCVAICRFKAIAALGQTIITFPGMCHGCGGCMLVCPEHAITETGRELGVMETGHAGRVEFVHGRLRVGEAMAPPLIKKVRSQSDPGKINIIDAPPGTSCPVIAATKDADFVIMVTEPTPFGMHDLKLAVDVMKVLGVPCGLVINRSDIGDDAVREYAKKENLPVLMEIPFDRKIAEAYSKGLLAASEFPEWREKFAGLFGKIQEMVFKGSRKG